MEQVKKELLLAELKEEKLTITWDDPVLQKKLTHIIENAEFALNHKLGAEIDYSAPGMEHELFLNYCMYAYNDVVCDFDLAYRTELIQIRHIYEVKRYREQVANETAI